MLKYINEEEYKKLLGVESIPDDFNKLVVESSSYIDRHTFGRIDENKIPEEVKYTTCLIINLIYEEENELNDIGNLKSQNIEGWSESYATPEEIKKNYSQKKKNTLSEYLWNTIGKDGNYLLNRGV